MAASSFQLFLSCVFSCSVTSNSLQPHGLCPWFLCPWDTPGKSTGVGCHALLPTQESNPHLLHLLHWQADSLPLSHIPPPPPENESNDEKILNNSLRWLLTIIYIINTHTSY